MAELTKQEHAQEFKVTEHAEERVGKYDHITIISHSRLFYWWPVWALGFIMAGVTYFGTDPVAISNGEAEQIHPSSNMGLIFTMLLFAVVMITNVTLRGILAVAVILGALFLTVLFAWLDWWDDIFRMLPDLRVRMNFGFYMLFSTMLFIAWCLMFFVFDRLVYWKIQAGQVVKHKLIGGGEEAYDTYQLAFEEKQDDPFRHWLLGLGAGDLKMMISGPKATEVELNNVLFADRKVKQAQYLIKHKPD
jgi:hypothetical protein